MHVFFIRSLLICFCVCQVGWAEELGALAAARAAEAAHKVAADDEDEAEIDEHGRPAWLLQAPDADAIEKFRRAKDHKLMVDEGRQQFALSHKKGLQYFLNAGLVENTPEVSFMYLLLFICTKDEMRKK